jgi:acyl-CoA reductase-like NAD-dependent aldehyde dehydrogenase
VSLTGEHAFELRHPGQFFIGGQWVTPSTSSVFDVINPATEELVIKVAEAQAEDIHRAVTAARTAFDAGPWPWLSHAERAQFLQAIADGIRQRAENLASIHTSEMGILYSIALGGIEWTASLYDFYAAMADDYPFIERQAPRDGGNVGYLVREPVGVVGAIIPWNGPLSLIASKLAPALLAGCTAVIKASPEAPGEAAVIAELAESVGLPPGVLNVVTAGREVSELLVRDARVDKISFTGSTAAGRRIATIMGERIGRYTLELGGKSAAVILDDYDVATAAATLADAARRLTGQVCNCLNRIVVTRNRHDELVEALSESFSKVKVGDPFDPEIEMGPLAMRRQRDRVEQYVAIGQREGAKLVTGGGRPAHLDRGFFIEPTVFADVDNSSTIAQEEIFGPVLSVIAANDERHAIDIANDTIYGLNAAVFSNDISHAYEVARRLRSGTVGHNAYRSDYGIGFGGFKQSGIGREGGRDGLLPYLESKTLILDEEPPGLTSDAG